MPTLLFATPAYKRFALTEICLKQRKWAIDELAKVGIEATCVVVADDENLEIARSFGFPTVEMDNQWLGRKFNAGYRYAGQHGFDYIFPIGSDSWIDPVVFSCLPMDDWIAFTHNYSIVRADDKERTDLRLTYVYGVGFTLPVPLLKPFGYAPCDDEIQRGCDGTALKRIHAHYPNIGMARASFHQTEYIAFQSGQTQITGYRGWSREWTVQTTNQPFSGLTRYPKALRDEIQAYYTSGQSLAA